MQHSLTSTTEPAVMRVRVLKLLAKLPELAGQFTGRGKESFQIALLSRLLPGILPMVTGTIMGTTDERLLSYISFIKNTLAILGDPSVSEADFEDFLNGKIGIVDGNSSPEHAHTTGPDAA